ncbi:urea ABC transporter ATP-binding protein UrtD [Roseitalea porphyridii]|uniref:urea ABC transporter ATP-binding protein UrtD n=1 Tax=Roseitalea porphyridii TaxID=1852022 RepID=UPI0032EE1304
MTDQATAPLAVTDAILYVSGVTVTFDGFRALNELSLFLEPGELRAVIGPNGAGKSTMMDVITGKTRPDKGEVLLHGRHDLTKLDEAAIASLGVGRKFQRPTVFESQTVFENLELALKTDRGPIASLLHRLGKAERARIDEVLEEISLKDRAHEPAGLLSHGQKQWLEIGMLLAQDPDVLLIDEPAAGMTDAETMQTAEMLKRISGGDRSVVVVEHDMEFVRALGCRVTALHEGTVLAEGTLDAVSANEAVIEVYLGR